MGNFRQFDRATGFLLPPSLDEWLPERHLARFVVRHGHPNSGSSISPGLGKC
jgi:hypothetical protein